MKKLIDFKTLKEVCIWESRNGLKCSYPTGQNAEKCCDDNCPVWKKLKEPESFTLKLEEMNRVRVAVVRNSRNVICF